MDYASSLEECSAEIEVKVCSSDEVNPEKSRAGKKSSEVHGLSR